jgi:Na+-transporting NADH:ubiquinone oxidoreductase subunit C
LLLALAATMLRPRQQFNVEIDQKKNILVALGILKNSEAKKAEEIQTLYSAKVKEIVLDNRGEVQTDKTMDDAKLDSSLFPLYKNEHTGTIAFPVEGMGLWSLLQGYFALESDGNTVAGITFYEQKETAGLGAEIAKPWFQENFVGKKILNESGKPVSVTVVKGKAADATGHHLENSVDGISGATITGKGVSELLKKGVNRYQPFLEKLWNYDPAPLGDAS